ncbi:unnamed protein product [Schistosoma margrebowiei]|uniref:Uncharacterized protein n=1 Tax=Schistosoma margrebowiei TaxID=48269 RepID=A0A183N331_9TREM|nr:unnamed protein product [Schistosoma margrebowiei]
MKTSTFDAEHGIQWTAQNQLEDLVFTDNLALLYHTHEQMQMKTTSVAAASASASLDKRKGKGEILKYNTESTDSVTLNGETLEEVESFTYLDSTINEHGGSYADVKARVGKARTAFLRLKNIWNSKQLSANQYEIQNLQY